MILLSRVRKGISRLIEYFRIAFRLPPHLASHPLIDRQSLELFFREFPSDREDKECQTLTKEEAEQLRARLSKMVDMLADREKHLIMTTLPQRKK